MNLAQVVAVLATLLAIPAFAQPPTFAVKQSGAVYIEAPPDRDKNLAPIGTFGTEKVEAHAIVTLLDSSIFATTYTVGGESNVRATALLPDKTAVELGSAEISSWAGFSDSRKRSSITISVKRLPDKPAAGVAFTGTARMHVAQGVVRKSVSFVPKAGNPIDIGLGNLTVSESEAATLSLSGTEQILAIAELKLTRPDKTVLTAKRNSTLRFGSSVKTSWSFSGPLSAGQMEITFFDKVRAVDVPLNLIVVKPY